MEEILSYVFGFIAVWGLMPLFTQEGGSIPRYCIGAVCAYIAIKAYGDAGYRW